MKLPFPSNISLRQRLFGMLALLAVSVLLVGGGHHYFQAKRAAAKELAVGADATMVALKPLFERVLLLESMDASIDLARSLPDIATIYSLEVSWPDGHPAFIWTRPGHQREVAARPFQDQGEFSNGRYFVQRPLLGGGDRQGWVTIEVSTDRYRAHVTNAMATYIALALGLLLVFSVVTVWLDRSLASPITRTTDFVETFFSQEGRDLRRRIEIKRGPLEMRRLQRGINKLLGEMEAHDHEMRETVTKAQLSEKASRDRSRFIATMSHELRTPLNSVIGFADLLDMERLDSEQRGYVGHIKGAGEHLLSLINDTLDLSKLESNNIIFERKPYRMGKLVMKASQMFAERSRETGVPIFTSMSRDTPDVMVGDQPRVQQVLINLIGNACKFTKQGSIAISVYVSSHEGEPRLTVAVKDTGTGIPLHRQAAIFERFQQADGTTTRDFGGTGLGLAIVKELVERMGGEVHLQSEPGVGSTFAFSLPMPSAQEREEIERREGVLIQTDQPESNRRKVAGDRKLRVLLADDVVANQVVGRRFLEAVGCDVVVVANGQFAVDAFKQVKFDAVFLDFHMPVMDGLEATRIIRGLDRGDTVAIWALTADATPEAHQQCTEAGMDGVITKPFQMSDLKEALGQLSGEDEQKALA